MTIEEITQTLQTVAENQAKHDERQARFDANMVKLEEAHTRHTADIAEIDRQIAAIVESQTHHDRQLARIFEVMGKNEERFAELADSQRRLEGFYELLESFVRDFSKVTAFVGLEPCEESSADKVRWRGISKAGSRLLRFLLIEAAGVAIKYDDELKRFYLHLLHRRDWRKAKVAVARKLLVRAWIMLRDQIDYAEFLKRGVAVRSARTGRRP